VTVKVGALVLGRRIAYEAIKRKVIKNNYFIVI